MKKKFNVLLILLVLVFCANPLFAKASDKDVMEAYTEVMGVWAKTGAIPAIMGTVNHPNMEIKKNAKTGRTTIIYKNFPTKEIIESFNESIEEKGGDDILPVHFDYMSGEVSIDLKGMKNPEKETTILIDVKLKGGANKVKTLWASLSSKRSKKGNDVANVEIKANGRRYPNVENDIKHHAEKEKK